jgi:glucose-1-phosphatase
VTLDAVLLDLGNVLVWHDNAVLLRRFGERGGTTAEALRQALPLDLWDRLNRGVVDEDGLRAEMSRALGVTLARDEFLEMWSCHFTVHQAVLPLVESLVGRVRLVLVSNTNEPHIRWVRARLPLLARFDGLVLSHEVGLAKPDAAIFREALARARAAPDRAAFFDDLPEYVDAANRLGIHGRVFTTAERFRAQLAELGVAV